MKKLVLALSIIFTILTFVGAGYVLANHSHVNAGFAVVPMVLAFIEAYRNSKKK